MVTLAELREKHKKNVQEKESPKGEGGNDFYTLKDGSNLVRILPGKNEALNFYGESHVHKYVNEEGKRVNYTCRKTQNEKCPLCDLYFDLWKKHKDLGLGKDADGKQKKSKYGNLASSLRAKERYFVKAVIRDLQAKGEDPVKFLVMSKQPFDILMAALTDPDMVDEDDPDNTTIISLERGNDFDFHVGKKGDYVTFEGSKVKAKKTKAGNSQEILAWMENQLDINKLITIGEYDEGKKIAMMLEASLTETKVDTKASESESGDDDGEARFNKELKV